MTGLALPTLAAIMAALLALGPIAALVGARAGYWGSLLLCLAGSVVTLVALLSGATPATLSVPLGLVGQATDLALDGVSALFLLLLMLAGAAAAAASLDDHAPAAPAACFPAFLGAMALTLLAGDAFALLVGFELMSLASFALVVSRHRDPEVRAAGVLYLGMAGLAGFCLIGAFALLATGGAGFAAIRTHPPEGWRAVAVLALAMLGCGAKAGLVPLHVWLPPAHAAAPGPVSALMSGVMTKVALYVLIRLLFDLSGPAQPVWWCLPLLVMGIAGSVLGALRANLETDLKTILACSTIENVGLIAVGLGLALAARASDLSALAGLALAGSLLHVLGHGLFKTLLFLGSGAIQHQAGSRLLSRLGGVLTRMPITGWAMLLGAACLAGLPPTAGFASEWMLFQAVLASVRLGGLGLQIFVCVLAAAMALATALAACAAVRLVGVALLGRPRSQQAAVATEAGPPMRWALLSLAALVALIGLFPGAVIGLAEPALLLLANTSFADRVGVLGMAPAVRLPGYAPLGIVALLVLAAIGLVFALRARAVGGYRIAAPWEGGFPPAPAWLPFGDPLTQTSGGGFAQPLRRVFGIMMHASARVDMPAPGDTREAIYAEHSQDPADRFLFAPVSALRARLSAQADRLHFLTVRQTLTVMACVLIGFLIVVALLEQA